MDKEKADKAKQTQKAKTEGAPETDGDVVEADSAIQQKSEEQEANIAEAQPAEDTSAPKDEGLPPAKEWDLRPYPLNRAFVSQPVLSEEMRDLIYQRVVAGGQSVVQVSAQLGVSLERVAAVVRLKQIEKDWQKDVSASLTSLPTVAYNDDFKIFSISLEDTYMVISILNPEHIRNHQDPSDHLHTYLLTWLT